MTALLDMDIARLARVMDELGAPKYLAKEVFRWLHKGAAPEDMTNVPRHVREALMEIPLGGAVIEQCLVSAKDGTRKYLYALADGERVEGVRMKYRHGDTLCVSTQAGCRMGCVFCASTLRGLSRNLTPGEMLAQVLLAEKDSPSKAARNINNIVLMGSGEPFDNLDNVLAFLRLISDKDGFNMGLRHISISTCGLVDGIEALIQSGFAPTLALSLHAPTDELRAALMPVAKKYPLAGVMAAVRAYVAHTGRRAIIEYALISGVNDAKAHAEKLAALLRGFQCHVNLIPLNDVPERSLEGSPPKRAKEFLGWMQNLNISATLRREMGNDILGACGQLRHGALCAGERKT